MTWRQPEDLAKENGTLERFVRGMIRRVAVTLTTGVLWQIRGYRGSGGDETHNFEPFTGIGFYSTPPSSGNPEAILAAYGATKTTAIIALRDEATRKVGAGDLAQGETCVYNDKARIIVKADGTVEIRLHGGIAVPLATLADVQALRGTFNLHAHSGVTTGAGVSGAPTAAAAAPTGTSVLKAQ